MYLIYNEFEDHNYRCLTYHKSAFLNSYNWNHFLENEEYSEYSTSYTLNITYGEFLTL